jgi:lysine 6-dehydrogenase
VRIVVLGGAGWVGRHLVSDLAAQPEVDDLVVADIDREQLEGLVASLPAGRVTATADVGDDETMTRLVENADVLMNCTSARLFEKSLSIALRLGVNYADLLYQDVSDTQQGSAQAAGVTAISGLGICPGLTNVLVRHAADEYDRLEEVHIGVFHLRAIAPSPGLLDTVLWQFSAECDTRFYFQNGELRRAAPLEGSRLVKFAPPFGEQIVYYVPHPEPVTLSRNFPSLTFCAVRGTKRPEILNDIAVLNKYGLLSDEPLIPGSSLTAREATTIRIWQTHGGIAGDGRGALKVEVVGVRDGERVRREYDVTHPESWGDTGLVRMTGVCAAVGAQLLGRHGRTQVGFRDVEAYYNPLEYLDELTARRERDGEGLLVDWRDAAIEKGSSSSHEDR